MNPIRLIPMLSAAAVFALGAAPAASAATADVQQASSQNWSGYVVGGSSGSSRRFSSVSASWVQPTARCASGPGYAAFWVGLGGSGQSAALEQAGTESDCSSDGSAKYFAWYELVPSAPVRLGLAVRPGDRISSRVSVSGTSVIVSLSDRTTGQSVTRNLTMSNPDSSTAEWVAEAPSSCDQAASNCSPLPLTNFATVSFTGASATSAGHTGTISDSNWSVASVRLTPQPSAGGPEFASAAGSAAATPSRLSSDGSSFSVLWSSSGSGAASATTGSGYPGSGYAYGPNPDGGSPYGPDPYGAAGYSY